VDHLLSWSDQCASTDPAERAHFVNNS